MRGFNHKGLRLPSVFMSAVALALGAEAWAAEARIHAGEPVAVGNGSARVIVAADDSGAPTSVSVVLSADALEGLPGAEPGREVWEYVLPMPADAPSTGYDHIGLDWNPKGHIPEGVYSVPHFDVHFYLVSGAERDAISYRGENAERARQAPDGRLVPAGYVVPPESAVERMGTHGLNPQGPEFNGQPFTHAFLYGYHAGRLVFVEPMLTLDFLRQRGDVTVPVPTPEAYSESGWYPTRYRIGFDPDRGEYRVALTGLRRFEAAQR